MNDPNIEVVLTNLHDLHCFKLIFHAKPDTPEGIERYPLEIYLHTTQAIELVHKLSLAICAKHHLDSEELLRVKFGVTR